MRRLVLISLTLLLALSAGCVSSTTSDGEYHATITGEDGTVEITGTPGEGDWCKAGTQWSMTKTGEEAGAMSMVVVGLVDSGKYAGYCHVKYDVQTNDTNANVDYYFDEEGSGYQVMVVNGETYEYEWRK